MKIKTSFALFAAALALAACSTTQRAAPVALGPAEKAVTLTAKDRKTFVALLPNGTITVDLDANVAAGYRWKLAAPLDPAILKLVSDGASKLPAIALPPEGPTTPEPQQWVFQGVGPGTTKVRMIYSRPNEPLGQAATFDFTVNAE